MAEGAFRGEPRPVVFFVRQSVETGFGGLRAERTMPGGGASRRRRRRCTRASFPATFSSRSSAESSEERRQDRPSMESPLLGLPCDQAWAPLAAWPGRLGGRAALQLPLRPRRAVHSSSGLARRPRSGVPGRGCPPPPPPPPGGRPASGGGAGATARARRGGGGGVGGVGEHAQFSRRRQAEQEQSRAAGMEGAAAAPAEAQPEGEASAAQPPAEAPPGPGAAPHGKTRGAGGRRGGAKAQPRLRRPVTVDSSKARTSLDALKISLRQLRWREFPFGRRLPCDIYWHGVSFHDNDIFSGQVNKFPGMTEMVRKITLSRAVRIMQDLFPEEYNFYPRSWILPEEFTNFLTEVRLMKDNNPSWKPTFIVKPDGGCQGDGIYLIKEPSEIRLAGNLQSRPAVVQEYISKPLLIDKLKFDIRLYVLLKSLEPLEVYVAKDGLSRFCTVPYQEPTLKNLHQVFMHLTNYSLNIHSGNFVHSDSGNTGSKRTFSSILYRLSSKGVDIKKVWSDIIALVIKTVIAMIPELKVYYQSDIPAGKPGPSCFQILGFDILLMKNLKPILLEVNANPSMRIEHEKELSPGVFECVPSPVDEEVKVAVIRDTLRLVDPHKKRKEDKLSQPMELASQENKDFPEEESMDKLELEPSTAPENKLPTVCLKPVFPKYSKQFNYLRLVERIAVLFIRFLGVRGTTKLGPTGFRTFVRNCKISNSSFSMAAADILYIDISRKWNSLGVDQRESGMGLHAFVEAFFFLAQRRYKSLSLHEQVELLTDFCEYNLAALDEKRVACSRGVPERRPALVTCQQDRLHLRPTSRTPPLHHHPAAHKLVDYRSARP